MRKRFYAITILSFLLLQIMLPLPTAAADTVEWQLRWQDNGVLQEEIHISGPNPTLADNNWNVSQEGDRFTLRREVEDWASYEKMRDKLPLQVQIKDYFVFKKVEIKSASETSSGLFQTIDDADQINLGITVPGFIISGSGQKIDESSARWMVNHSELSHDQRLMIVITVNGLLLGIVILMVGLLFVAGIFIRYLRKANRIIEEEYSLTKIKKDPLERE
ncbi:MAG: hypothetical protein VB084_12650 [Syntrophomonadaceae bacterium]|nr:hypothetical protein [Syntrophomonadaceae bacterium]